MLARALERAGVEVSLGQGAISLATSERRAEVVLSDHSTASADLIVGADGRMASIARRYVHGDNTPSYQGVVTWVGIAELERDFPEDLPIADYWGVGRRFGIVPVSRRTAYWAGARGSSDTSRPEHGTLLEGGARGALSRVALRGSARHLGE